MSLSTADVAGLVIALALLLLAAHTMGYLFAALHQPPVIGEIVGGLLLGPTVLGALVHGSTRHLFTTGVTGSVLGAIYQLGLLLLMFLVGTELRFRAGRAERRTVLSITAVGLMVPFAVGWLIALLLDFRRFAGPHGSATTFALIFGIAIAVTSIPVISRILMDLGILDTAFSRVVLTVAVLEDIALYVVLAVVLGLAQAKSQQTYGLWAAVGSDSVTLTGVYYVAVSLVYLACTLVWGGRVVRALVNSRANLLEQRSPTAFRLLVLLGMALICMGLGINSIFGALMAGIACGRADAVPDESARLARAQAWSSLKQFSLAFFIPIYFAIVGLQLDLIRNVDVVFFCWFFVVACIVKAASVWAGARLAGEDSRSSLGLAVAMNARGGPGIVLATVTFAAGLVNEKFFTALILLSIFTSQIAGFWLDRTFVRRGRSLETPVPDEELIR
jgi:K+:H+ antiporter